MAESQVPYPNHPHQVDAIRASLSEPRFGAYLVKGGGDVGYALALYLYNARLAKAFLFPLSVVEVTLRNAIDAFLTSRYGATWPHDHSLRHGLLTAEGLATLDKAISRAGQGAARGRIVSQLTFDFWSNLLRRDYSEMWRTALNMVFPNVAKGMGRHEVQQMAKKVNQLRNRVAHHEPILDQNAPDVLADLNALIGLRCRETAEWTKHHTTVGTVLRTRPRMGDGSPMTLRSRQDDRFVSVAPTTTLDEVMGKLDRRRQVVVCVDGEGKPVAAFSALDVIRFVAADAARHDGLFAPAERTVQNLMDEVDVGARWLGMFDDDALDAAIDELRKAKVDVLVGVSRADGRPTGAILRAHRRY